MSEDINGIAWMAGWNPKLVIAGTAVLGLMIGTGVDAIMPLLVVGIAAGIGIWFWGTKEINSKYQYLLDEFVEVTEEIASDPDVDDTFTLVRYSGSSPPLVEPHENYHASHLALTDVDVKINQGAEYNMKRRDGAGGGSNKTLFYDQIENIETEETNDYTVLRMDTGNNDIVIGSTNLDIVTSAESELRQRMRQARREKREV